MMLKLRRSVLIWFLLIGSTLVVQARRHPRALTAAETEARNENMAPGLSGQGREARRIAQLLADALTLTRAQRRAVEACTRAERLALALAATPEQAGQDRAEYRLAVGRVLDARQLAAYTALCQRLAGTAQALDGTELAAR